MQRASLIGITNQNQRNSLHEAVYYGRKTAVPLLLEQLADAATRNTLLLATDQEGKTAFYQALEQDRSDLADLLFNSVDSTTRRTLLSANNLAESRLLRAAPSLLRQFQLQQKLDALNALDQQIGKVGLWPVGPTSSGRCRRQLNPCNLATEPHFPYDVLTDRSVTPEQLQATHHYAQIALAAAWSQPHSFANSALNDLISYQRAIGAVLQIAPSDQSAREQQLAANHYQQANQFIASNPVSSYWEPITPETSVLPAEKQSWRFDNGECSLLASYDGQRYFLYSSDFNYQQRFQTNEGVAFSDIEKFAAAFFQWRSGSPHYNHATFKHPLTTELIEALKPATFWQPNQMQSDRLQIAASRNPASIEELPAAVIHDLFYINGKTPSPNALQENFFQHYKTALQLRVDQLPHLLPELTGSQQQKLSQLAQHYQWPATVTLPTDLPNADKPLFEAYQQQVIQVLRQYPITLEQLSALSWQLFQEHLDRYPEIPVELREGPINTLKSVHTAAYRSWAKTSATQILFFLPDLIRAANTGQTDGLKNMAGMLLGDTSFNIAYSKLIGKLATLLPASQAQLLQKLPVTSPIFKIMTIHSIVKLHQELSTLPSSSERYQTVQHQLHEQYATAGLMVAECIGFEVAPLWAALFIEQLITGANDFRRENHLEISFFDAFAMSLGFEQAKLQLIFEERKLVETHLAMMNAINAQSATPYGWTIVNLPKLGEILWQNVSESNIPLILMQQLKKDPSSVSGFKEITRACPRWSPSSSLFSRTDRCHSHWQQITFPIYSQTTTLRIAATDHTASTKTTCYRSMIRLHLGLPLSLTYSCIRPQQQSNNYFLQNLEGDYIHYQRIAVGTTNSDTWSNQPLKLTGTDSTALYANNLTFTNSAAQRSLFLAFDPRLGSRTLHWEATSFSALDTLNQAHQTNYSTSNTAPYQLTIWVGSMPYPANLIFPTPPPRTSFSLIDDSQRLEAHYLIAPQVTVYLNDTLPTLQITFIAAANHSAYAISSDTTEGTHMTIRPFNAPAASESQLLLAGKHTINLNLQGMVVDTVLTFTARRIQLDNVQGRSASLSQINLEPSVKSFTITLLGDITLKSPAAQLSVNTTLPLNLRPMRYIGVVREPHLPLHRLEVNDLAAIRQLLSQNGAPALSWIATDPTASLAIVGSLNGTAAVLTVNPSDETLTLFNHRRQPVRISTLHPTANITVEATLRFTGIGNTTENSITHPLILKKLAGASLGNTTILRFQASSGYPVYHLLPATQQPLRINRIAYRLHGKQLYAAPDVPGTLEAHQLIQANTSSKPSIPLYFATTLTDSDLTLTNDTLTVNNVTLPGFPNNTLIHFANGGSGFPLRV